MRTRPRTRSGSPVVIVVSIVTAAIVVSVVLFLLVSSIGFDGRLFFGWRSVGRLFPWTLAARTAPVATPVTAAIAATVSATIATAITASVTTAIAATVSAFTATAGSKQSDKNECLNTTNDEKYSKMCEKVSES